VVNSGTAEEITEDSD